MVPLTHLITSDVVSFSIQNRQSNATYETKLAIIDELNANLSKQGTNYQITAKGSTVNGFGLESSDLDLIALANDGQLVPGTGI